MHAGPAIDQARLLPVLTQDKQCGTSGRQSGRANGLYFYTPNKDEGRRIKCHEGTEGDQRYTVLLCPNLGSRSGCQRPTSAAFPGNSRDTHWNRLGESKRRSGRVLEKRKSFVILPPTMGIETRTVQHVASCFTDCSIQALLFSPVS